MWSLPLTRRRLAAAGLTGFGLWFATEFVRTWRYIKERHSDIERVKVEEKDNPLPVDSTCITGQQFQGVLDALHMQHTDPVQGLQQFAPPIQHDIGREACAMFGGGPAVMLQLAHPYVAYGIKHHSYTKTNITLRFFKTFSYVFAIGFGDLPTAMKAARTVRNIHSRVTGQIEENAGAFPKGHTYAAHQEDALLWVLMTLLDWQIVMYELCVRRLTDNEKEEFYAFHRRICCVWGVTSRVLPADWKSFQRRVYHTFASTQLTVTEPARDMAAFLLVRPIWERMLGLHTLEMVTSVLLPARIREAYQLRYGHREVWGTVAFFTSMRMFYRLLPRSFRSFTSYMEYRQRVTGSTSLPLLSRLSSWFGTTFTRLYFGTREELAPPASSPTTNDTQTKINARRAAGCPV